MIVFYCIFLIIFPCEAIVLQLNDTEYDRMPAIFGLEPYHACLRPEDGVYCLFRVDLHADEDNELMQLIRGYSEHTVKHYNYTYIQRGVCVSTTCRHFMQNKTEELSRVEDVGGIIERCFNDSLFKQYGLQAKQSTVYNCDKHNEEITYDMLDCIVAICFLIILAFNIAGSCYDYFYLSKMEKNNKENRFLSSFSIFRNWKWLTEYRASDPRMEKLKGFHFVKCILTFFIMFDHCAWINTTYTDYPLDYERYYDTWGYQLVNGGMMLVQMFFVLSAFTFTYSLLIRSERTPLTWATYPKIILLRFWRLSPAYASVLAYTASWLRHAGGGGGGGPLWQVAGGSVADACQQYAWTHLLYFNNYVQDNKLCALHTWYLAADFQLFVLGVAVVVGTRGRMRRVALFVLFLVGLLLPAWQVWLQDLDAIVLKKPEFFRNFHNPTFQKMHISGHANIVCCVLGIYTALLVYTLQNNKVDLSKNKMCCAQILKHLCWMVVPGVMALFASCVLFYTEERAPLLTRMAAAALLRVVMATISSFVIVALVMRINERISRLFEWEGWVVPGRLSYCVYLVHLNMVHVLLARRTHLSHVSIYNLALSFVGVYGLSHMAALMLHLLVEAPASRLARAATATHLKTA
ncbi:PREDICTED: nose resistant to fluoxetine protein 6-like isoform X1 [Papilio xuthus]|uniref:Nose resistant to fluoxetine protein 6-like isoform X1 n=2 Tax=Papilio xuthus TaxID=66420 RepID=A0AAJ6Z1F5_PAPXU|nr:PREDICTED: nose resistant to fluoxetine protein 6-like isoform X1 [Papilio xuthus]